MNFKRSENGQVLVMTAMCMAILMGFGAMAIDVGYLYRVRQNTQIAADAAATAAAVTYLYTASIPTALTAGQSAAIANNYTNGSNGISVKVNMPPTSGPITGGGYAEAIVTIPAPTFFMSVFGRRSVTVAARAVAGTPTVGSTCIWLLASTGVGLDLQGSYDVTATNCGIYVNSSSSSAIQVTGNGGTVNTKFIDVVGNSVPGHMTTPTPVTPNVTPRKNPWGNLNGPTYSGPTSVCNSGNTYSASSYTLTAANASSIFNTSSGYVCFTNTGGVTLSGTTGTIGTSGASNLPGSSSGVVYIFEYGLTIATGSTVTFGSGSYDPTTNTFSNTSGAVVEIAGGTLTQQSNSLLNIYAPTSSTYNGIAILQPPINSNSLQVQFGSNNEVLDGYIYAPSAEVYLQDSGGGIVATGIVANTMTNQTSQITIASYDLANQTTTPNRVVSMVE